MWGLSGWHCFLAAWWSRVQTHKPKPFHKVLIHNKINDSQNMRMHTDFCTLKEQNQRCFISQFIIQWVYCQLYLRHSRGSQTKMRWHLKATPKLEAMHILKHGNISMWALSLAWTKTPISLMPVSNIRPGSQKHCSKDQLESSGKCGGGRRFWTFNCIIITFTAFQWKS